MSKKAQMSLETIVGLIILVVLLVFVILYLTGGFEGAGQWWSNLLGGDSNLAAVATGCNTACSTESDNDWCRLRTVRFDKNKDNPDNRKWSCDELSKSGKIKDIDSCAITCTAGTPAAG